MIHSKKGVTMSAEAIVVIALIVLGAVGAIYLTGYFSGETSDIWSPIFETLDVFSQESLAFGGKQFAEENPCESYDCWCNWDTCNVECVFENEIVVAEVKKAVLIDAQLDSRAVGYDLIYASRAAACKDGEWHYCYKGANIEVGLDNPIACSGRRTGPYGEYSTNSWYSAMEDDSDLRLNKNGILSGSVNTPEWIYIDGLWFSANAFLDETICYEDEIGETVKIRSVFHDVVGYYWQSFTNPLTDSELCMGNLIVECNAGRLGETIRLYTCKHRGGTLYEWVTCDAENVGERINDETQICDGEDWVLCSESRKFELEGDNNYICRKTGGNWIWDDCWSDNWFGQLLCKDRKWSICTSDKVSTEHKDMLCYESSWKQCEEESTIHGDKEPKIIGEYFCESSKRDWIECSNDNNGEIITMYSCRTYSHGVYGQSYGCGVQYKCDSGSWIKEDNSPPISQEEGYLFGSYLELVNRFWLSSPESKVEFCVDDNTKYTTCIEDDGWCNYRESDGSLRIVQTDSWMKEEIIGEHYCDAYDPSYAYNYKDNTAHLYYAVEGKRCWYPLYHDSNRVRFNIEDYLMGDLSIPDNKFLCNEAQIWRECNSEKIRLVSGGEYLFFCDGTKWVQRVKQCSASNDGDISVDGRFTCDYSIPHGKNIWKLTSNEGIGCYPTAPTTCSAHTTATDCSANGCIVNCKAKLTGNQAYNDYCDLFDGDYNSCINFEITDGNTGQDIRICNWECTGSPTGCSILDQDTCIITNGCDWA